MIFLSMPVVGAALSRLLAETSEADEGEEQEAHRDADADWNQVGGRGAAA